MIRFLLILAVIALVAVVILRPSRAALSRGMLWGGAGAAVVLLLWLAATGRLPWLFAVLGSILAAAKWWLLPLLRFLPFLRRLWPRSRSSGTDAAPSGRMSAEEARRVLGLGPEAGPEAVIEAHRRLVQRVHPDRGGSDYLAARLNEAKDVLLGERGPRA